MANYLQPAMGRPTNSKGTGNAELPSLANDEMYRVQLYRNDAARLFIEGNLYEDFALDVSADWASPFAGLDNLAGSIAEKAGKFLGGEAVGNAAKGTLDSFGAGKNVYSSAKTWNGGSELNFQLNIRIDAFSDTAKELMIPMKSLLQTVTPDVMTGGFLRAPGPTAGSLVKDFAAPTNKGSNSQAITADEWQKSLQSKLGDTAFHLRVGKFFHMFPCIVESCSAQLSSTFEVETGHPMYVQFTLVIKSYLTTTSQDIENWIKINKKSG